MDGIAHGGDVSCVRCHAVGVAALLVNIAERKEQARHAYVKLVEVTEPGERPGGRGWIVPTRGRELGR